MLDSDSGIGIDPESLSFLLELESESSNQKVLESELEWNQTFEFS